MKFKLIINVIYQTGIMDRNVIPPPPKKRETKIRQKRQGHRNPGSGKIKLAHEIWTVFNSIVVGLTVFVPKYLTTACFALKRKITIFVAEGVRQSNAMPRRTSNRHCCTLHAKPLMFAILLSPEDVLEFHLYTVVKLSPGIALPHKNMTLSFILTLPKVLWVP